VAGECGDDKREIVYFGDTVNTAARIEALAKGLERSVVVSGPLLGMIALPEGSAAEPLGRHRLRGRQDEMELFGIRRAG
jgi:adenylate cyclase